VRGFVLTPPEIVESMVERLFRYRLPKNTDILLDPGCGTGVFLDGVIRWCWKNRIPLPKMVGIESGPGTSGTEITRRN
jgi:adenine-specific DNA-methyltransferase